jgi:hypothetical protein
LNNATGYVECDEELAARLVRDGLAQDPRIGANLLNHIEDAPPPLQYDTKVVRPKRR